MQYTTTEEREMTATCTVQFATTGKCGRPAVWTDGTFAECAEHAADAGALAKAPAAAAARVGEYAVGDRVRVARYGKVYDATVTKVGARGAAYATFTYGNGTRRTVRLDAYTVVR